MNRFTLAALAALCLAVPAAAQDCAGFVGKFRGAEGIVYEITDAGDGTFAITAEGKAPGTATCTGLFTAGDGRTFPTMQGASMAGLDETFSDPACCQMMLNGNQIYFSPLSPRYWQRTK